MIIEGAITHKQAHNTNPYVCMRAKKHINIETIMQSKHMRAVEPSASLMQLYMYGHTWTQVQIQMHMEMNMQLKRNGNAKAKADVNAEYCKCSGSGKYRIVLWCNAM